MENFGPVARRIHEKLSQSFAPQHLAIHDDSAKHKGHAGARPGGESHFTVVIQSQAFDGLSKVACQRLIYQVLREEIITDIHALSLKMLGSEESLI